MTTIRILKTFVKRLPIISPIARGIYERFGQKPLPFETSNQYWEDRYRTKGDSGDGSYGRLAQFKADIINAFVKEQNIESVIEFGCGDGAQLTLMDYPRYIGVDVSETILETCKKRFSSDSSKQFLLNENVPTFNPKCDLSLSLDVIYHLVEDNVFEDYMTALFGAASKWVIIYSSNKNDPANFAHVKHRMFTKWIDENAPNWSLHKKVDQKYPFVQGKEAQTSFADFYIYQSNTK